MTNLLDFFIEIGKLKKMPRRGWVIREIENPESIAEHSFRVAIMAWFLAKKKGNLNLEKIIKMALIHDICEVYAGDATPYDSLLPKDNDKNKIRELVKTWPRFSEKERKRLSEKKYKKEKEALEKLLKSLPSDLKNEIMRLWLEYEKGHSPEGKFFKHADRIENFLQAMEYWQKNKKLPQKPYWIQARELHDDPLLLDLIDQMDKKFHKKHKPVF
jgi:putative hydrolases of HD superfamily